MDGQKPQPYRKPKKMYMVSLDDRRVKVNSGITSVGESRMLMKSKCSEKQSKGRRRNVWNDSMVKATMGPLVMKQQSKEWVEWLSAKESEIDRVCQKDFKMQRGFSSLITLQANITLIFLISVITTSEVAWLKNISFNSKMHSFTKVRWQWQHNSKLRSLLFTLSRNANTYTVNSSHRLYTSM